MVDRYRKNLIQAQQRIADAAQRAGRNAADVTLIGVTKYLDVESTECFVEAGHCILGENRPQVLLEKQAAIDRKDIQWHLIGHLQRNKAKRMVEAADLIHSVDSWRLLKAIDGHAAGLQKVAHVLLEVNVSGDAAKHGFSIEQMPQVIESVAQLEHVQVDGLMAMAGLDSDELNARRQFEAIRQTADRIATAGLPANASMQELSMGMSGDFEMAIEQGATMVRLGSILFQ